MYRLDSHVISALTAFQGVFDSPELDVALGLSEEDVHGPTMWDGDEAMKEEEGLGFGMHIKRTSIYSSLTLPRLRKRAEVAQMFEPMVDEVYTVKDLDTGLVQSLSTTTCASLACET
jgi:hypothetical protein